jgi:hypothetical protein
MDLTKEGKVLFRKRVDFLVPREIDRTNFYYLLDQLDKRDARIDELTKLIKNILENQMLTVDEVAFHQKKLKKILN